MAFLQTARLLLRNLTAEDAEIITEYRNDEQCSRYQRWDDTSRVAVQALIAEHTADGFLSRRDEQRYAICTQAGEIVGDLAYFFNAQDNCITLGVTVAPAHQRRGYAYEMLAAVVAAVQGRFPTMDIVALIDRDNAASIRLFEKLGFAQECYAESIASYVYVIAGKCQKEAPC